MATQQSTDQATKSTAGSAPGADAESPKQIPGKGWLQITKRSLKEMGSDHLTLIAGGVAYAWFLALFPGMIAAITVYGLVSSPADVQSQMSGLSDNLPKNAQTLITKQLTSIANGSSSSLSIGLVISLALALWSASAGIAGLVEALNIAYDEDDNRKFVVKRGLAILLTIGFIVFLAVALGLVAVVPAVLSSLSLGLVGTILAQVARWVLLVALIFVALALLYRVGPDRDAPKLKWLSLGAVVAAVLWVVASVGFSLYVNNFGSYGKTYGSLAGVVVLLLWFWITALVVLLGAEINAETEAQTAADTTTGAPKPVGERDAVKADEAPPSA
ncbi:MAG: YihY/virulence factor BrkB family protein [Nocardioidaceae bacterium]